MKQIPLTQDKVALVDDEDYDRLVAMGPWCATRTNYAVHNELVAKGRCRHIHMHRVVLNAPDSKQVDHVNGDGLDNQKSNLRLASNAENNRNKVRQRNNTSGCKGVHWHKGDSKYHARIKVYGRSIHLGCFDDIQEAARAYDIAALHYFGEFALTNEMLAA